MLLLQSRDSDIAQVLIDVCHQLIAHRSAIKPSSSTKLGYGFTRLCLMQRFLESWGCYNCASHQRTS